MLQGKMDVIVGLTFSQKVTLALVSFLPKKIVLKQIREFQENKKDK